MVKASKVMSHGIFVDLTRKRKLIYDDDEFITVNQYDSPKKTKAQPVVKKRYSIQHKDEWNRCMEGFSDFTPKEKAKCRDQQKAAERKGGKGMKGIHKSSLHVEERLQPLSSLLKQNGRPAQNDPSSCLDICDWSSGSDDEDHFHQAPSPEQQKDHFGRSSQQIKHKKQKVAASTSSSIPNVPFVETEEEEEEDYSIQCSMMSGEAVSQENLVCRPTPHDTSSQSIVKEEEAIIFTYNSEDEVLGEHVEDVGSQEKNQGIESVSLEVTITSDPSQDLDEVDTGNPAANSIKGSDWLKKLADITPEKGSTDDYPRDHGDSTKKKRRKYVKFGFVEHLQRLQAREKSAFTFWSHKKQDPQQDTSSKSLLVRVIGYQSAYTVVSTTAVEVNESQDQAESSTPIQVLFTKSRAKQIQLEVGCEVKIQPPWQTLDLPNNNGKVILCTNYCTVTSRDNSLGPKPASPSVKKQLYIWSYRDKHDATAGTSSVPSEVCQTKAGQLKHQGCDNLTKENPLPQNRGLHCVNATQLMKVSDSIMDSIEIEGAGTMNASVTFNATVQRIVCKRQVNMGSVSFLTQKQKSQKAEYKWSILLQDIYGAICEVSIHDATQTPWADVLKYGEGRQFTFHNLLIHHRTNREKAPSLFSIIDSLWLPIKFKRHVLSQEDSTQAGSLFSSPPSFCYILTTVQGTAQIKPSQRSIFTESILSSLLDVVPLKECKRVSFEAKVVYLQKGKTSGDTYSVYVTYSTISQQLNIPISYVHIQVQPSCGFPNVSDEDMFTRQSPRLVFRDVWLHNGNYLADAYTKISKSDQPSNPNSGYLSEHTIKLPALSENCNVGMLVTLQGRINLVDEESAYSWPACNVCGNDKLTYQSKILGELYCVDCCGPVHLPVNKMRLDVFLQTHEVLQGLYRIKIQLRQSTIEAMLPEEPDEEGYDIQCVLDKDIGPINCIITSVQKNKLQKKNLIQLTEIELWT